MGANEICTEEFREPGSKVKGVSHNMFCLMVQAGNVLSQVCVFASS